jgi:hypothetical protein
VEEQSHKSEMRAALQGDFERLRARRQPRVGAVVAETSGPDHLVAEASVALSASPVPEPPPRSWLDRLRGLR